jgi:hypothetical protein
VEEETRGNFEREWVVFEGGNLGLEGGNLELEGGLGWEENKRFE